MNSSLNIKQKLNCGNQYHRLSLHNEKELTIYIYNWVGSQKCYIEWESKNGIIPFISHSQNSQTIEMEMSSWQRGAEGGASISAIRKYRASWWYGASSGSMNESVTIYK